MHKLYKKIKKSSEYSELFLEIEKCIREIQAAKSSIQLNKIKHKAANIDISNSSGELSNKRILLKNLFFSCIKNQEKNMYVKTNKVFSLNNVLRKKLYSGISINKLQNKFDIQNKFIGSIPGEFFTNIQYNKKKEAAYKLFNIFLKYTYSLNYDFESEDVENEFWTNILNIRLKEFERELSNITAQTVNIEYLEHGTFGNVYKITINDKYYAYKVFFPYKKFSESYLKKTQGLYFEPQAAYYAGKSTDKNLFVNFFAGKISSYDDPYSYIITEFITPEETSKKYSPFHYLSINKIELKKENIINGRIIDFGGLYVKEKNLKDKDFAKLVRIIWQNLNYNIKSEQISWKLTQNSIEQIRKYSLNKNYLKAINLIKHKVKYMPYKLLKALKEINNAKSITIIEQFNLDSYKTKQELIKNLQKFKITVINEYYSDINTQGYLFIKHNGLFKRIYFNNKNIIEKIENISG